MYRLNLKLYQSSSYSTVRMMMVTMTISITLEVQIRAAPHSLLTDRRAFPMPRHGPHPLPKKIISKKTRNTPNCRLGQPRVQQWSVRFSAKISDARRRLQTSQPRLNPLRRWYLPSVESSIRWINRTRKIRQQSPKRRTCCSRPWKNVRKKRRKRNPRFPQSIKCANVEFFLLVFIS